MKVDPRECASAADLFGSKARPDTIEIRVDLVYELTIYAKTLTYLLSDNPLRFQILPKAVQALAQLDGFRHFKALLPSPLGYAISGENAGSTVGVEAEDSSGLAEAVLVRSGYFRRSGNDVFLERVDQPSAGSAGAAEADAGPSRWSKRGHD